MASESKILLIFLCYCFVSAALSVKGRKLEHRFSRSFINHSSKKVGGLNLVKHLDVSSSPGFGEVDDINEHDHDGNLGSLPFSLPSSEPAPIDLTENIENTPPFCEYPPSSTVPSIPPPSIPAGQGGSYGGGSGGSSGGSSGGYTPQPFPSSPSGSPTPPPPPPLPSSSNYEPSPPIVGFPGSSYVPPPPSSNYEPSPPIVSPGSGNVPPPPSTGNYEPIPPIVGAPVSSYVPPPPSSGNNEPVTPIIGTPGSSSGYGFVPSPPIFQPPVVFPPPRVPPRSPNNGANSGALWCVAKPAVPDPIIEEAMNYACGSGADCESLQPNQPCYQPDTLLAHASYAFNSYWQRTKAAGGTCEFGGTAILVTVDPSYDGCQFLST